MTEFARARPPRVFVPDLAEQRARFDEPGGREILLLKEETAHVRTRRLRDGDEVVALDGKGLRLPAKLTRSGSALSLLPFEETSPSSFVPGEPANRVTVALACAEPVRVEWAVEKGTECGAAGFVLLASERSQRAHVAALASPARLARLRRIAVEATKQCDRTVVPFVEGPKSIRDFLGVLRDETLLVANPAAPGHREAGGPTASRRPRVLHPLREFRREETGATATGRTESCPIVVAIGPEGGFAPAEISSFGEKSAAFFSLGPRVLRLETAVVVALCHLVDGG